MISRLWNAVFQPCDAAAPAAFRAIIGSALLAGAALIAAAPAAATPTFGAFARINWAPNTNPDGGWGDFDGSVSWSATGETNGWTAAAMADLATGSLHASSMAWRNCTSSCPGVLAAASAMLFDRYYFDNEGDNAALIPVSLRVEGSCSGGARNRAEYRFAFSSSPINTSTVPWRELPCDGPVDLVAPINLVSWVGDSAWYAFVELSTGVSFGNGDTGFGLVDFGNTLKVDIVLPDGVTMRSDSGVFPWRRASDVPEPATLGMFGAGLAGLGAACRWVRRERKKVAA